MPGLPVLPFVSLGFRVSNRCHGFSTSDILFLLLTFQILQFQSDAVQYFLDNLERISKIVSCVHLKIYGNFCCCNFCIFPVLDIPLFLMFFTIFRTTFHPIKIFFMPVRLPKEYQSLSSTLIRFHSDLLTLGASDLRGKNGFSVLIL